MTIAWRETKAPISKAGWRTKAKETRKGIDARRVPMTPRIFPNHRAKSGASGVMTTLTAEPRVKIRPISPVEN